MDNKWPGQDELTIELLKKLNTRLTEENTRLREALENVIEGCDCHKCENARAALVTRQESGAPEKKG